MERCQKPDTDMCVSHDVYKSAITNMATTRFFIVRSTQIYDDSDNDSGSSNTLNNKNKYKKQ